jgi:hypothetical protein
MVNGINPTKPAPASPEIFAARVGDRLNSARRRPSEK